MISVRVLTLAAALVLAAAGCAQGSSPQATTSRSGPATASASVSRPGTAPASHGSVSPTAVVSPPPSPTVPEGCSAKLKPAEKADHCLATEIYAGYSASPPDGTWLGDVEANWTVPAITCPANPDDRPRAAVWVALWGSLQQQVKGTGWLPQIGTSSDCNDPLTYGATYHLAWEMYAMPGNGAGNTIQEGLNCSKTDPSYDVCASHYTNGIGPGSPINIMPISAGDKINAAVALVSSITNPNHPEKRVFEIRLTDLNNGDAVEGYIRTNEPVTLDQIDGQGGVIVESTPACTQQEWSFWWWQDLCKSNSLPENNGLAEFDTPIQVTGMALLTFSPAAAWSYNEWVMQRPRPVSPSVLAQDSDLAGSPQQGLNFTVTWLKPGY